MRSQFRIPCYYFGLIAENKKIDEHTFLQHHLLTTMTDKVLRQELNLPSFKLFEAGDEKVEEDISPPKLTILQWSSKDGLICPDALKKRWETHDKFSEGFAELANHREMQKTRQLKREASELHSTTPNDIKRLKSQVRSVTEQIELPDINNLLSKVLVTKGVHLFIYTGPKLYIQNDNDVTEIIPAGVEVAAYFGQGAWWQKAGAKKDEEPTDADFRFGLADSNTMIMHAGIYNTVGEVVNAVREAHPDKGVVQYHKLLAKPRDGYPGFPSCSHGIISFGVLVITQL